MPLKAGTKLGVYEIVGPLGAGGMGEVYRARDSKLQRDVAVKVLPDNFARDPDRLLRFQREAQLLAALNHANIGVIHDLQEDRDTRFLVLELVEGESLAERLKRGPLGIDESLEVCKQIAEALEAAHEKGILHRDLKPANIQITTSGHAKVLDFGLAKLVEPEASADVSNSPTLNPLNSAAGVILGTASYMSPEQARGTVVDRRTDIWAFGCVLFETLTGRQAFQGETITDILAAICKDEPNWSLLPAETPPTVRLVLRQCLQKQSKHRLHDIADVRIALESTTVEPGLTVSPTQEVGRPSNRRTIASVIVVGLLGLLAGWLLGRLPNISPTVTHLEMSVQPADQLGVTELASVRPSRTALAISPDGRLIVFHGTRSNTSQLFSRRLDQTEASALPGTEGAATPVFSPDGKSIAFWADNRIKKVALDGGPPVTICDLPDSYMTAGMHWSEDGNILFGLRGVEIQKVSASGGKPETIVSRDPTRKIGFVVLPHALPGRKEFLVTAGVENRPNIALVVPDTKEVRTLIEGATDGRYIGTGHILYVKTGTLMAVPFDVQQLRISGDEVALVQDVMHAINPTHPILETGAGQFAFSDSGTLLYATGSVHPDPEFSLGSVDRKGNWQRLQAAPPRPYFAARLSPDGTRIAISIGNPLRTTDIWLYDRSGQPLRKLTEDGSSFAPVWSPDGRQLVYSSIRGELYVIGMEAGSTPVRISTSDSVRIAGSWTAAGNRIAVAEFNFSNYQENSILVLSMDGDPKPEVFLKSRHNLVDPQFSPDGKWIAYVSDESGADEVYVQAYPGPGEKIRISTNTGISPFWTSDRRELLYLQRFAKASEFGVAKFFSVPIRSWNPFKRDTPRLLFEGKPNEYETLRSGDITHDGQKLLTIRYEESKDKPVKSVQVVLNWSEELKRRVRPK